MRVGLVSPYSYTYPGGVGRHVEALAQELIAQGHDATLLTPFDPPDRRARVLHRGAEPEDLPLPEYGVALGRTVGIPFNGAVSNVALGPAARSPSAASCAPATTTSSTCTSPTPCCSSWQAVEVARVPVVGTFHTYSTNAFLGNACANVLGARRMYRKLSARIAVSEAARWTAERFYGGTYRLIPNGVDLAAARPTERDGRRPRSSFCSWAAPRSARACPSCCAPSKRCAERAWRLG